MHTHCQPADSWTRSPPSRRLWRSERLSQTHAEHCATSPAAPDRPAARSLCDGFPSAIRRRARGMVEGKVAVALVFTANARRLGIVSAVGTVSLGILYDFTLVAGLLSLQSPQQPIGDPLFSILEILIILMMPLLVTLIVAIHAWATAETKVFSVVALVFVTLLAGVTCGVHFVILTVGRQAAFAESSWMPLLLSFKWPSVFYALDILAWDVFFALSVLFAAPVFSGNRLARCIRMLMIASGVLALAGLSGVIVGDMQWRNIGIAGYGGAFPVAAALLVILFYRATPREA